MKQIIIVILFSGIFAGQVFSQISDKEVLNAIKYNQNQTLIDFLEQGADTDRQYDKGRYTLLIYAIKQDNTGAVKILLEHGANPDLPSKLKTPLAYAVLNNQPAAIHLLIVNGARLDTAVKNGKTALMFASKAGRMDCVKMLIENGADAQLKSDSGLTALDYANMANYPEVAAYLVKILEMRNYYSGLPDYTDGPHMEWVNDTLLRMFYMIYDMQKGYPLKKEKYIHALSDTLKINGFAYDTAEYAITRKINHDPTVYKNVDKVLAIGDIHGHYNALVKYLLNNHVIDANHNWIWGTGHVVFLGDVFDRGNEVTESLWFIYQLDQKARKQGGRVHMLLGNHEVMVMLNDTRYLNRKYEVFSNYFMRDPADYYGMHTILGNWLRTRNAIIKINDCIFSHAGISPTVLKRRIDLENINEIIREYLSVNPETPMNDAGLTNLLLNAKGPLWYRGYILNDFGGNKSITEKQVTSILNYYQVSKIIIAHTEVKRMISLFGGKVIAIDVPIRTDEVVPEALLIEEGKFYRLTALGEKSACIFEVNDAKAEDQLR